MTLYPVEGPRTALRAQGEGSASFRRARQRHERQIGRSYPKAGRHRTLPGDRSDFDRCEGRWRRGRDAAPRQKPVTCH